MSRFRTFFSKLKKNNIFSQSNVEYKYVGRRFIFQDSIINNDKENENEIHITQNFSLVSNIHESKMSEFISFMLDTRGVNIFMFFLILSFIVLQSIRFTYIYEEYLFQFNILEISMLSLFTVELFLRLYSRFDVFFLSIWNIIDLGLITAAISKTNFRFILTFKAINLLHSKIFLSLISYFRFFRITLKDGIISILRTATDSLPDVLPIVIILTMTLVILAVNLVYVNFNSEDTFFSDIPKSMFALFTVMSLDGIWVMVDEMKFENGIADKTITYLIILLTFFLGKCILCNIIVAVMTSNLLDSLLVENRMNVSDNDLASNENALISYDILRKKLSNYSRTPIQDAKLTGLNWNTVRTYHLLLVAFEDNLLEYKNLKFDLEKIIDVIRDLEAKMKEEL